MDVQDVLADLERRIESIPLGNSDFQNRYFVVGTQDGPARQYRAALLRAHDRQRAVMEAQHARDLEDIELAELAWEIEHRVTAADGKPLSEFDVQRRQVRLRKAGRDRDYTDKLIRDALAELATLYAIIREHEPYTREQFERLEAEHYASALTRQFQNAALGAAAGALESLQAMQRPDVLGVSPALMAPLAEVPALPNESEPQAQEAP